MHAYVGLGANLGARRATLHQAAAALGGLGDLLGGSRLYETAPWPDPSRGPAFLNGAVLLRTALAPEALMKALLRIEEAHGRARDAADRCAPRTLDLDVLLLGREGEVVHEGPALIVPHPRLHERAFALAPLLDIQPDLAHPVLRRPLRDLLVTALLRQPAQGVRPLSEGLLDPLLDPLLDGPCARG